MTRWTIGEADIDTLISKRHLEVVVGDAANGAPWLDKAATTLESARVVASEYPSSAYVLSYDAARCVCVGVLAQWLHAATPESPRRRRRDCPRLNRRHRL